MDIRMPVMDGLEALEALGGESQALALHLRKLVQEFDIEGVWAVLERLR